MVFLTISKKVTGLLGPVLFRSGLVVKNMLSKGSTRKGGIAKDSPYLDMALLIPYAQKMMSLTVYDDSQRVVASYKNKSRVDQALDNTYDALFGASAEDVEKEKASISDLRVGVLEDNLRPALLPNDRWGDVMKWRWNYRIMKWARMELLVSKHGPQVKEALDAYPQLRASPQLSRHPTHHMLLSLARGRVDFSSPTDDLSNKSKKRKSVLPSSETIIKAFEMRNWAQTKNSESLRKSMIPILRELGVDENNLNSPYAEWSIDSDQDIYDMPLEEVLEIVSGGHVLNCGPLNTVCEEADIYQMWTQEYVQHLGDYLLKQQQQHEASNNDGEKKTIILDVGAGDGLLMYFLQDYMENTANSKVSRTGGKKSKKKSSKRTSSVPTMIATDDGSWGIFAKAPVEKLGVEATLKKYCTDDPATRVIVLCSWMPMGHDWTAMFRSYGVDEYILIGEADDGSCGNNWATWGNSKFIPEGEGDDSDEPLYERDDYQRWDIDVLTQFQFSRFDCAVSRSSKTVSFRKKKSPKDR